MSRRRSVAIEGSRPLPVHLGQTYFWRGTARYRRAKSEPDEPISMAVVLQSLSLKRVLMIPGASVDVSHSHCKTDISWANTASKLFWANRCYFSACLASGGCLCGAPEARADRQCELREADGLASSIPSGFRLSVLL